MSVQNRSTASSSTPSPATKTSVTIKCHALSAGPLANIHPVLSSIYQARGIQSADELDYELKGLLPYHDLHDIDKAAKIIADAITSQQRILIVGDFDADGATSTALGIRALRQFGALEPCYLVPNRFEYGYGLTPEIVEIAHQKGAELLITVDSGISCIAGVEKAKSLGLNVIVTDHHLQGKKLPPADAIINPNQHCRY